MSNFILLSVSYYKIRDIHSREDCRLVEHVVWVAITNISEANTAVICETP